MPSPSWLLLAWSGFAATLLAAVVGTALGARAPHAWSLAPCVRSTGRALAFTAAAGLLAYPIAYAFGLEAAGRADIRAGLVAGLFHAAIMLLLAAPRRQPACALRVATAHIVYASAFALFYVLP